MARPRMIAAGTVITATSRQTSSIVVSAGVNMNPLTPSTPTSVESTGISTSTVSVVAREPRRST